MSRYTLLTSTETPNEYSPPFSGSGTLTVNYRVKDGVVQPQGLDSHFTGDYGQSILKIHAESAKFEKLGDTFASTKPATSSFFHVQLARILPVSAAIMTIIVLITSRIVTSQHPGSILSLIWAAVNIPFCLYQVIAGFIGRVNYTISFGITIILALGAVAETVLSSLAIDFVGGALIFVIAVIHIADAVVLARIAHIARRCGPLYDEEDDMTKFSAPLEELQQLPSV